MIISDGRKIKVYNGTSNPIDANKIVVVKGKRVVLASNTNPDAVEYPLGYTLSSIDSGGYGEVLLEGSIQNINSSSYTDGALLYLNTNGNITTTKPATSIIIGAVITSDALNGSIYFKVFFPKTSWGDITGDLTDQTDLQNILDAKQDTLISGINIQTINGNSILGPGNLEVSGVPIGGNTGDILAKASATDYDVEWIENYTSSVKHIVKLGENINKGQAVYVSSADGTNMVVSKASNATEATSSKTMGLLAASGTTNAQVYVITEGLLAGLDTSAAIAAGDPVWLGANGNLLYGLANKPVAPIHMVFIGIVTRKQSNNGEIFVKVQNGFELQELHNVLISSPADNEVLTYESSTGLWKNKTGGSTGPIPAGMTWMGAFPG